MSYPTKLHTRANSAGFYHHILSLFDDEPIINILTALEYEGIKNLMDFIGTPPEDLVNLEYIDSEGVHYLTRAETRLLKSIHSWISWESISKPMIDFESLTLDDYDQYLLGQATRTSITPSAPVPVFSTPYQGNIQSTPFSTSSVPTPTLLTNVKLDIKQYPVFHGENASWPKFKRGVLSIASTHGLEDVFDKKFSPPAEHDPDYHVYNEKNRFVYSIWISRIVSGLALSILRDYEETRDGRGVYFKLLDIYEGKHNLEQVAIMAMNKLSNLHLTYNYPGGVPAFISKFRDAQQDLRDAGQAYSDTMAKSMLLSKISDNNYRHIVDALMVSQDNCEECMQRLLDKFNLMNQNKSKISNRNVNKTNKNQQKNHKNNQNTQKNNNMHNNNTNKNTSRVTPTNFKYNPKLKDTIFVEPDEWNKMSWDDRFTIMANRKKKTNADNNNKTQSNFNSNKNNTRFVKFAETQDEDEECKSDDDTVMRNNTNNTPSINSIMTSIRHMNPVMCNSSIQEVKSLALIDSGADTCMLSEDDFYIEAQYDHRRVTIEGFSGISSAVRNLRIGKGITAVDIENKTILLRINEGVITPYKTIISTNQVRNFGHKVDDVPIKYKGTQSIKLTEDHILPLEYKQALVWLHIRKPTRKELN